MTTSGQETAFVQRSRRTGWGRVAFVGIVVLAAVVRLYRLGDSPPWFLDEGTYFDVARNLLEGRRLVGQMEVTFAAPHMTAPPAWFLLEAAWMGLLGTTMTVFRLFTALCGVGTVLLAAAIARTLGGRRAMIWTAALLAVLPRAVLYSRMAIPYTPASFFLLLWFASLLKHESAVQSATRQWYLGIACGAAALASLSLYYCVVLIPVGFLWSFLIRKRPRFFWTPLFSSVCGFVALMGFVAIGWVFWGEVFRSDLRGLSVNASAGSLKVQWTHWMDFLFFWGWDASWWEQIGGVFPFLGFFGFLFLRRRAASTALAVTVFLLSHIVLRRGDTMVTFIDYPMTAVLPFLAIGIGSLIGRGPVVLSGMSRRWMGASRLRIATATLGILFWLPIATYTAIELQSDWSRPTQPTLRFGMLPSVDDARAVADWVNESVKSAHPEGGGLVLASVYLWPLLDVPHSDANQLLGSEGRGSGFYEYEGVEAAATPLLRRDAVVVFIEGPFTEIRRRPVANNPENIPDGNPWMDLAITIQGYHEGWVTGLESGEFRVQIPPVQYDDSGS